MTPTLASHLAYAVLSLSLVAWVGRALKNNGDRFLREVFPQDGLADAVNQLLLIGFYLLNIGFISLLVRSGAVVTDATQAMELLAGKIGVVALVLGGLHFVNLFAFSRIWKTRPKRAATRGLDALGEILGAPTSAAVAAVREE